MPKIFDFVKFDQRISLAQQLFEQGEERPKSPANAVKRVSSLQQEI